MIAALVHSCVFLENILPHSFLVAISFENHALTKRYCMLRAILHITGQTLCTATGEFRRGPDAFFKRTIRCIPITSRVGWCNMCDAVYRCGLHYDGDYLFQLFSTPRFTKCISPDKIGSIFPYKIFSCGMYTIAKAKLLSN